jgi:hypothetical protein
MVICVVSYDSSATFAAAGVITGSIFLPLWCYHRQQLFAAAVLSPAASFCRCGVITGSIFLPLRCYHRQQLIDQDTMTFLLKCINY